VVAVVAEILGGKSEGMAGTREGARGGGSFCCGCPGVAPPENF